MKALRVVDYCFSACVRFRRFAQSVMDNVTLADLYFFCPKTEHKSCIAITEGGTNNNVCDQPYEFHRKGDCATNDFFGEKTKNCDHSSRCYPPRYPISSGAPGMRRAVMGFGAGCGVGSSWVVCSQDFAKK